MGVHWVCKKCGKHVFIGVGKIPEEKTGEEDGHEHDWIPISYDNSRGYMTD